MPTPMYSQQEVAEAIRIAWVTGVRDALISAQGHTLTDEQVATLATFLMDYRKLRDTVMQVLQAQRAIPPRFAAAGE